MTNNNKTALISGATSGFGTEVAKHLIKKNYSLIILGRSKDKINNLIDNLKKINEDSVIHKIICDLSSFKSVKDACEIIKKDFKSINLLILNAGLWNFKFKETEDKIEETLQVNLLSPVFIFQELAPLIPKDGESKVIFTSSGLHQGQINFSDIEFRNNFSGFKAYRQSKLGLILITHLLSTKAEYSGITFNTVHPGFVKTELGRNAGWLSNLFFKLFGKSKEKGAETHKYLINQSANKLTSGEYYANSRITKTSSESHNLEEAEKLMGVINNYTSVKKSNETNK